MPVDRRVHGLARPDSIANIIIQLMKHPPCPALLRPAEVAAPSKRGPSAFILAPLIETSGPARVC